MEKFEHAPSDKIDTTARNIIENVFGHTGMIFVANETPLEFFDYDFTEDEKNPPKGHELMQITNVPEDDKDMYGDDINDPRTYVWYPPFSDQEIRRMSVRSRIKAVRKIEKAYQLKLKQYKNIDNHPELGIAEIADHIDRLRLLQLNKDQLL